MDPELDAVAEELYALPRDDFTRERNARAGAVGDPEFAAAIRALRKPSLAAWTVGLLVRSKPAEMAETVALGAALRAAQEELDATALAALTAQRRKIVATLAKEAAGLADDAGAPVSRAVMDDVAQTLDAALRDAAAEAAVRSGRLVRALRADGFDPVDLDGAVAGSMPAVIEPPQDELAERRARREAERAARDAVSAAEAADRDLVAAEAAVVKAQDQLDRAHARVAQLQDELDHWQRKLGPAEEALATAERARTEAMGNAGRLRRIADERVDRTGRRSE